VKGKSSHRKIWAFPSLFPAFLKIGISGSSKNLGFSPTFSGFFENRISWLFKECWKIAENR